MEILSTFQDFAIGISFTLLMILIITKSRKDYKAYLKSKYCLLASMALLLIQFSIQRFGMLRMQADYSLALVVNIAFFMPVAYLLLAVGLILLTNDNVPRRFHVFSALLYFITLVFAFYNIYASDAHNGMSSVAQMACGAGFLTHLIISYRLTLKAYRDLKLNLDNYYDYDTEQMIAFLKHSSALTMLVGLLAPVVIITNYHDAVAILIGAFGVTIIYFTTHFIGYEKAIKKVTAATLPFDDVDYSCYDAADNGAGDNAATASIKMPSTSPAINYTGVDVMLNEDDDSNSLSHQLANWVRQKKHLHKNLTIIILAEDLGTNQKYLSRYFSEVLHTTFREWLNDLRMQDAKIMLLDDHNLTIENVAQECGFGSRTHFHSVFVKKCGMTPSQFRSENSYHYQN